MGGNASRLQGLFTGISGTGVNASLAKLKEHLSRERGREIVHFRVEPEMRELAVERGYLKKNDTRIVRMLGLPRLLLRELWRKAFENILERIAQVSKDVDVFLSLHACYYHVRTREFLTVVDEGLLRRYEATAVINLIDDVYDVFARLACPGGLFDRMIGFASGPPASIRHFSRLFQILQWRSTETLLTDHLAESAFGEALRPIVLAVKHPLVTAEKILCRPAETRFYLSHPVSEPRRMGVDGRQGRAKALISEVKQVADSLRQDGIVFEPTTIDELRFLAVSDPHDSGRTKRVPVLLPRWPLGHESALLWSPIEETKNPLDPGGFFSDIPESEMAKIVFRQEEGHAERAQHLATVSDLVEALSDEIGVRVSSRDHRLVEQADHVVAYRPVFAGNASGGVRKEIEYHRHLKEVGLRDGKSGVFVLTLPEDLDDYRRTCIKSYLVSLEWVGSASPAKIRTRVEQLVDSAESFDNIEGAQAFLTDLRTKLEAEGAALGGVDRGVLADEPAYHGVDSARQCAEQLLKIATEELPPYTRHLDSSDSFELKELMTPIAFADKIKTMLG